MIKFVFFLGLRWSTKSRDLVQTYSCAVWIGWSGLGLLDSTVFSDSLHSWSWSSFCSYGKCHYPSKQTRIFLKRVFREKKYLMRTIFHENLSKNLMFMFSPQFKNWVGHNIFREIILYHEIFLAWFFKIFLFCLLCKFFI